MASDFLDKLSNPESIHSSEWDDIKDQFNRYKNRQFAKLSGMERQAKENYTTFRTQARDQLTQAVRQLKSATETDALRRGLTRSSIHGSIVGGETARMEKEIGKQTDAAKSAMDKTIAQVRASRAGLAQSSQAVKNIDDAFQKTERVSAYQVNAMSADYTPSINYLTATGVPGAVVDSVKDAQKAADEVKSTYDYKRVKGADEVKKKMLAAYGLTEGEYDPTSTKDTLGNRLYWAALDTTNSLIGSLKTDFDVKLQAADAEAKKAAELNGASPTVTAPSTTTRPDFNADEALKKRGLLADDPKNGIDIGKMNTFFADDAKRMAELNGTKGKNAQYVQASEQQWNASGYHYDEKDKDDVERRARGLPPKTFLREYSNSEEDQKRRKEGKLPVNLELKQQQQNFLVEYNYLLSNPNTTEDDLKQFEKDYSTLIQQSQNTKDYLQKLASQSGGSEDFFNGLLSQLSAGVTSNYDGLVAYLDARNTAPVNGGGLPASFDVPWGQTQTDNSNIPIVIHHDGPQPTSTQDHGQMVLGLLRGGALLPGMSAQAETQPDKSSANTGSSSPFQISVPMQTDDIWKNEEQNQIDYSQGPYRFYDRPTSSQESKTDVLINDLHLDPSLLSDQQISYLDSVAQGQTYIKEDMPEKMRRESVLFGLQLLEPPVAPLYKPFTNEDYVQAFENRTMDEFFKEYPGIEASMKNGSFLFTEPFTQEQKMRLAMAEVGQNGWNQMSQAEKNVVGLLTGFLDTVSFGALQNSPDKEGSLYFSALSDATRRDATDARAVGRSLGGGQLWDALETPSVLTKQFIQMAIDSQNPYLFINPDHTVKYTMLGWENVPEYADMLTQAYGDQAWINTYRPFINLAGDVILDPLNFVPLGVAAVSKVNKIVRIFKNAKKIMKVGKEAKQLRQLEKLYTSFKSAERMESANAMSAGIRNLDDLRVVGKQKLGRLADKADDLLGRYREYKRVWQQAKADDEAALAMRMGKHMDDGEFFSQTTNAERQRGFNSNTGQSGRRLNVFADDPEFFGQTLDSARYNRVTPQKGVIAIKKTFDVGLHTQVIKGIRSESLTGTLATAGHTLNQGDAIILQVSRDKAIGAAPYSAAVLAEAAQLTDGAKLKVFRAESVRLDGKGPIYRNVTREYAPQIAKAEGKNFAAAAGKEGVGGEVTKRVIIGETGVLSGYNRTISETNIQSYLYGSKSFDDVLDDYSLIYSEGVNGNQKWQWDEDILGGDALTKTQKRKIKENAVKNGYILEVKIVKVDGRTYADFLGAGVVKNSFELPDNMWHHSDDVQFRWLDEQIGGHLSDYTWHHSEAPGVMQLVPYGIHNITFHNGARTTGMWADAPR